MKILAIDTTSEVCGVAILEDEKLMIDTSLRNGLTHSENLIPCIQEALEKTNLTLKEIDLIAVSTGPGSFTGIRIGVASVKAMAEVNRTNITEVTSLESLAQNIEEDSETKVALIDARNHQCYCGIFDNEINQKEELFADDMNVIIEKLEKYHNITFVGNGAILHQEIISQKLKNSKFAKENEQKAYSCGLIGLKKYQKGLVENADTIIPRYLRKSQAERLKNNKEEEA